MPCWSVRPRVDRRGAGRPAARDAVRRHLDELCAERSTAASPTRPRSPTSSRRWSTQDVGDARCPATAPGRRSIRIHGRGPLSDLLASALRCSGARVRHSSQPHAGVTAGDDRPGGAVGLSWSPIRGWCATCTTPGIRTCRCGCATAPGLVGPLVIPGRDQLPAVRGPAPQRPRRGLARGRRPAARHRRQRRPGDRAGHRGAGAQPGRPRHRGGARRRRSRHRSGASAADAGHHAGVRRQHRLDRGAPMVAASAVSC